MIIKQKPSVCGTTSTKNGGGGSSGVNVLGRM